MTSIELLGPSLLDDARALAEIDRWLDVMDRPNGWHYDLDIIWILHQLEAAGIAPGMTVLDAGAGLGVTQFVLAARGYRVISLDYAERDLPPRAAGVFTITRRSDRPLEYQHSYQTHVKGFTRQFGGTARLGRVVRRLRSDPGAVALSILDQRRRVRRFFARRGERARDHGGFGSIEFVRASFHEIPVPDAGVDAVVSVSAIEHSDKAIIVQAFREMRRVTRAGGPILVTTSAAGEGADRFHEQTQGHCFSEASLRELAGAPCAAGVFEPQAAERALLDSRRLWARLDLYFYRWDFSLFRGQRPVRRLPYLPVGLRLQ